MQNCASTTASEPPASWERDSEVAPVGVVKLNRPHVRNAVDERLATSLLHHFTTVPPQVRVVVLASAQPGMFCAGADLKVSDSERSDVSRLLYEVYQAMLRLPIPIVAAIDGPAVGGGAQLVLAADCRIASPRATFRFPGIGHGLAVGTWGLTELVGGGNAFDLITRQQVMSAQEAHRAGVVQAIHNEPVSAARARAIELAALDAEALARVKRLTTARAPRVAALAAESGENAHFTGAIPPGADPRLDSPRGT